MQAEQIGFLGAFVAGLLSFLSPCVLPLIPSYITYITGLSLADLQAQHPTHAIRRQTLLHSLLFIGGFTTVFVLLGASATLIGSALQQHADLVRKAGGVLVVIFGIHVTGLAPIHLLLGEKRINLNRKPAGYLGSFMVGIAFAAGWTPCIGPILASILMVAATEETVAHGIMLLLVYSVGLGVPFLLSSLALHRFLLLFNRFKKHIRMFEIATGIFLIVIGIMVYKNYLSVMGGYSTMFLGG